MSEWVPLDCLLPSWMTSSSMSKKWGCLYQYGNKGFPRFVMLCKFTISFRNQKFYVKSGFQFSLKNFQRWFCVIELRPCDIKRCKQKNRFITTKSSSISNLLNNLSYRGYKMANQQVWSLVKMLQFSNWYWNTLKFVSKVTLKANE